MREYTEKYTKEQSNNRMARILGFRNYKEYQRASYLALHPIQKIKRGQK